MTPPAWNPRPWSPPHGVSLDGYELGDALRLFAAFAPGQAIRTRTAEVDGLRALATAAIVGGVRWAKDDARAIQRCFARTLT